MQHLAVGFACGEASCRSSDSVAVLDDLAVGFAMATTIMTAAAGVSPGAVPVSFSMVGTVSGALTGKSGCGCDTVSKKTSLDLLFFFAGQPQSYIAT
jgi:hypothetical protein